MYTKAVFTTTLLAVAEARFGQEQVPVPKITALSNFGSPGVADTLAGAVPGVLLAAADPCAKLSLGDQIVAELGNDPAVIAGAAAVVGAEQNFNPFVVSVPSICGNASLPATQALRGIVPLVDPAVVGSDTENANANASLASPFDATGLTVAQVMIAQGFSNFTVNGVQQSDSSATGAAGSATSSATAVAQATMTTMTSVVSCGTAVATATVTASVTAVVSSATVASAASSASGAASTIATGAGAVTNAVTGNFAGFQASSLGLDFGKCTPTVKFEAGLDGRPDTEFTFQAQDPLVNKGQEEALNPEIIFNRICDQLVNVCGVSIDSDAHTACENAKTQLGGGAKNSSTADAWNSQLGFAGTNLNPDNAPQAGLVGHT
ncbi:hypothetical protein F5Y16DRAFT_287821 [Xylariaceae sp. FL0255]|nr:hypothetical protein F5Y16DRAFT_287821 [Xylariaceae sp. FL0255]